ncbi:class I SAM-dependent methyltransferase [Clostridium sp. D2Q-14]|uniref:methyltransferase domain-containing protein n=1 Tax=Anaeromonas gelatinilytica TaxID=2683194 RepID=UPI00193BF836|nr:class I SAM-dependent methyltransferase [Anaeromonas gelatinilytica]MBS4534461.1 class I SAM-dependent methyltransferase [Anaeromonas gelatinilytica]
MYKNKKEKLHQIFEQYDKLSPDYPLIIFKDIIKFSKIKNDNKILEIGSGTGKSTEGFIDLGYSNITSVEIEYALGLYLWNKFKKYDDFNIIISSFEEWDEEQEYYDLVFLANSFYLVQLNFMYNKIYRWLKNNGTIALFCSTELFENKNIDIKIMETYGRIAPKLINMDSFKIENYIKKIKKEILNIKLFNNIEINNYTWNKTYSSQEYIEYLNTFTSYNLLDVSIKEELYDEIINIIEKYGGVIEKIYLGILLLARKT